MTSDERFRTEGTLLVQPADVFCRRTATTDAGLVATGTVAGSISCRTVANLICPACRPWRRAGPEATKEMNDGHSQEQCQDRERDGDRRH